MIGKKQTNEEREDIIFSDSMNEKRGEKAPGTN